ncbi:hypothetical protein HID58_006982 [Brassica napus]|uniref:Neprosin PEP catalytic domain-containing protein n=1 Tax=Brassica napus TaxID=3708 RepID=A0ABQ8ED33_BRANA|nr:hypothetical protein HID58_008055 [Brassica napus]KAH0939521.1 hypothetical protein HID58_006982 [Brassica napus]
MLQYWMSRVYPIIATKSHSLSRRNEATRSWQHTSLHPSDIGYWPKELFNLMDNGGNIVGAGGVVHASPFGSSPAMGHGQFPKQPVPLDGSPTFSDVKVMNSKYESHRMDYFPIEKLLDSPQCYGIEIGINEPPHHDHRGPGKDDNATKSKKTRKVQFDPQGPRESKYTFLQDSDEQIQGSSAKGGKGSKARKSTLSKESQPLELKTDKELPENAKCLMDCEAFEILQGIKEQMAVLSEDPSVKLPVSFDRGLEYVKYGRCYMNPQSVRQILEPLKKHGVSESEMCVIANVCPESIDEVFAFVPSMKGRKDKISEPLEEALMKLSKLKRSA